MANTTSGTYVFGKNFSIDEIVEEAYERCGVQSVSGYQLKAARRSLNILFQEWGNRGLHYWEVANNSITLVDGKSEYTMYRSTGDGTSDATAVYGVADVLEATYRNASSVDAPLTKIDRSTYQAFSNKTAKGQPTQYWVQRFIDKVTITLYLTPGSSQAGHFLNYYYVLYKMCELLERKEFLPYFPMLKDPIKRIEQDEIWKKICKELHWEFIPTI